MQAFITALATIMSNSVDDFDEVEVRGALREVWESTTLPNLGEHVRLFTGQAFSLLAPEVTFPTLELANKELQLLLRCYAGQLTNRYAGHSKGYPASFDAVELFPGRMAEAASFGTPSAAEVADKPWLIGCRRMIFVSDMSDALSESVSFEYLLEEVVKNAASAKGKRHIFLWLTKRPGRMVEFCRWLSNAGIAWPGNLIPMSSIINAAYARQAVQLLEIPAMTHGFSVEPLDAALVLPQELLEAKSWIIVGGESGKAAHRHPFNLAWARAIRDQCLAAGAPFFMKQMGASAYQDLTTLNLKDSHGGDWAEWPLDLRIRQVPMAFRQAA